MRDNNAKDFNKFPELFDCYMDRLIRAHAAATAYFKPDCELLTRGLYFFNGLLAAPRRAILSQEIRNTRAGDAKRPDSIAMSVGGVTRDLLPAILKRVQSFFRSRLQDVQQQIEANTYRQHLVMAPGDGDIQRVLHCDTFFPALKYWYFPEPVDDGAFVYAENSPVLTEKRLEWHQAQVEKVRAGQVEEWRGAGHAEGSFRISGRELADLGLCEAPVRVPGDCLVVANVFGFHRRGDVSGPVSRLAVSGSVRFKNPFLC